MLPSLSTPQGWGPFLSHCPAVNLHPEGICRAQHNLVLFCSTLQEMTSQFGLVLGSTCKEPSLLTPLRLPYLHLSRSERQRVCECVHQA